MSGVSGINQQPKTPASRPESAGQASVETRTEYFDPKNAVDTVTGKNSPEELEKSIAKLEKRFFANAKYAPDKLSDMKSTCEELIQDLENLMAVDSNAQSEESTVALAGKNPYDFSTKLSLLKDFITVKQQKDNANLCLMILERVTRLCLENKDKCSEGALDSYERHAEAEKIIIDRGTRLTPPVSPHKFQGLSREEGRHPLLAGSPGQNRSERPSPQSTPDRSRGLSRPEGRPQSPHGQQPLSLDLGINNAAKTGK